MSSLQATRIALTVNALLELDNVPIGSHHDETPDLFYGYALLLETKEDGSSVRDFLGWMSRKGRAVPVQFFGLLKCDENGTHRFIEPDDSTDLDKGKVEWGHPPGTQIRFGFESAENGAMRSASEQAAGRSGYVAHVRKSVCPSF